MLLSTKSLIKALRICVSNVHTCNECPLKDRPYIPGKSTCHDLIMRLAAARLEESIKKGERND